MKKVLLIVVSFLLFSAGGYSKDIQSVVFRSKLHCENCVKKVVENISFLKGVKDLKVSLQKQEINVTFDADKISADKIAEEIKKLGYPAEKVDKK